MSKTTLIANSLFLSLVSVLALSIIIYLAPLKLAFAPFITLLLAAALSLTLAVIYGIFLKRKFGTINDNTPSPQIVLVNETWLLKQ